MALSVPPIEIAASKPFAFVVGPNERTLYVHGLLAAELSPPFACLIYGNWLEKETNYAVLDDVDEDTFMRFLEYAYSRAYSVPLPAPIAANKSPGEQNKLAYAIFSAPRIDDVSKARPISNASHHLWLRRLLTLGWLHPKPLQQASWKASDLCRSRLTQIQRTFRDSARGSQSSHDEFEAFRNDEPSQSLEQMLLAHARCYVFADRYCISALRSLALLKLKRSLAAFKFFQDRIPDFYALVAYTYPNTPEGDDLRLLLVHFAACMIPQLVDHPGWGDFITREGVFVKELLARLRSLVNERAGSVSLDMRRKDQ